MHTDHSDLRHLFKKQDAKPCLIRWILPLQEFDIKIKDRKGTKNVVADHLSWIKNDETSDDSKVDDNFPGETLMEINTQDEPCLQTPTGTTRYKLVYGKNCHLPFELEHRAYWALIVPDRVEFHDLLDCLSSCIWRMQAVGYIVLGIEYARFLVKSRR
ncbi:hypothetical protein Tco_0916037 [Tanacetum coccineum]